MQIKPRTFVHFAFLSLQWAQLFQWRGKCSTEKHLLLSKGTSRTFTPLNPRPCIPDSRDNGTLSSGQVSHDPGTHAWLWVPERNDPHPIHHPGCSHPDPLLPTNTHPLQSGRAWLGRELTLSHGGWTATAQGPDFSCGQLSSLPLHTTAHRRVPVTQQQKNAITFSSRDNQHKGMHTALITLDIYL